MSRSQDGLHSVGIAAAILLLTSLSLAGVLRSTGREDETADRDADARASLRAVAERVTTADYADLLGWNGLTLDRGDHTVVVAAAPICDGLIAVEVRVVDDLTGAVLGRRSARRASGA
jgi:hypothetical protein